jgi:hypothetical protein
VLEEHRSDLESIYVLYGEITNVKLKVYVKISALRTVINLKSLVSALVDYPGHNFLVTDRKRKKFWCGASLFSETFYSISAL